MAESNTGSWVRRVGASGGGRTYRRQRPVNFYGVLVIIVILGLLSVAFARYEYRHPANASTTPPTVGTTWFAALGTNACGSQQPPLSPNPITLGGYHALSFGALKIAPTKASEAGENATLQKFIDGYLGLKVTSQTLAIPGLRGLPNAATTWNTGDKCAKGTKDAGKVGHVEIAYWPNIIVKKPTISTDPTKVRFTPNMLITFFFGPEGTTPPKPPESAIKAMLNAALTSQATTTTLLPVTTTTQPTTTTTTARG